MKWLWVPAAKTRAGSVAVPKSFGAKGLLAHPGKGGMGAACDAGITLGCAVSVDSHVELLGCKRAGDLQPLFFRHEKHRGEFAAACGPRRPPQQHEASPC